MTGTMRPEPPPAPRHEETIGAGLAIAQFLVTGVLLGLVATLAYLAGMRSAGKEGGGEAHANGAKPGASVDVAALLKPTPELTAKGKSLFAVNCASCHGANGFGDGPAAAALNPKPRNFHEGYWKYGGGVVRIVRTISTGSPGTAMAAFTNIPLEDRFALAHYVRSLSPKPEEDKPEDLAWLGPIGGAPGGGTSPPEEPRAARRAVPPGRLRRSPWNWRFASSRSRTPFRAPSRRCLPRAPALRSTPNGAPRATARPAREECGCACWDPRPTRT